MLVIIKCISRILNKIRSSSLLIKYKVRCVNIFDFFAKIGMIIKWNHHGGYHDWVSWSIDLEIIAQGVNQEPNIMGSWREQYTCNHGRSQDFSKGGSHWLIQRVLIRLPPEYCRLFAHKKAYKGGGVTGTPGPPLATPFHAMFFLMIITLRVPHVSDWKAPCVRTSP